MTSAVDILQVTRGNWPTRVLVMSPVLVPKAAQQQRTATTSPTLTPTESPAGQALAMTTLLSKPWKGVGAIPRTRGSQQSFPREARPIETVTASSAPEHRLVKVSSSFCDDGDLAYYRGAPEKVMMRFLPWCCV